MKYIYFTLAFLFFFKLSSIAQVSITFHENFENPGNDDSVTTTQTVSGIKDWNLSTVLHYTGSYSDTCQVKTGATTYLTSQVFSTVGNYYIVLEFAQIAKVDFLDIARIEVSADGGTTWTQLTGAQYLGLGAFGSNGNKFTANSYGTLWVPSQSTAKPLNTWWKVEQFDVSSLIPNDSNARVRFKLADGGTPGPNNNYGWCLDDIKVKMSFSEMTPPTIVMATTNPTGTILSLGPFTVKAKITDASGIDTAILVYSLNNGIADTLAMSMLTGDTMFGIIPALSDSANICYRVVAFDSSPSHNMASNPVTGCVTLHAKPSLPFPYFDNFDNIESLWTTTAVGSSLWQKGTPAYGVTNSAHSAPNAWDVNLSVAYTNNANCTLSSPQFCFTGIYNASLSFWINYKTEATWDGTRLEYSTNGTTWSVLGVVNDPLGNNWYNSLINSTNKPAWNGNSNGWKNCSYDLSQFNNQAVVYFRFIFNSDGSQFLDGFSIDDFMINIPATQSVALKSINNPSSGCALGLEAVSIRIKNTGTAAVNGNLAASYRLGNGPIVTETITNPIPVLDSLLFTFSTPVNLAVQADSTFSLKAWISLLNDPNPFDDTLTKMIVSQKTPLLPQLSNQIISYGSSASLAAVSGNTVNWYNVSTGGTILFSGLTFVTPVLYSTTVFYAEAVSNNGCKSSRAADTVFINNIPLEDGVCLSILSPSTGYFLSNQEQVAVLFTNYGTQSITNFTASYQINGLPAVNETVTQSIPPYSILVYTFTTTGDFSAIATYTLKAWITITADTFHNNDTVIKQILNQSFSFCTSYASSNAYEDIGNVTISNVNNGNPLPVTNNTTATQTYSNFTQSVPPIQLTRTLTYPVFIRQIYTQTAFNVSCKIFVDWNHNGIFDVATETAFTSGPSTVPPMSGNITVPYDAYLGQVRFRVVLVETSTPSQINPCGTYGWGETEDYTALISPLPPYDASLVSLVQPLTYYASGDSITPTVLIKNSGGDTIHSMDVSYRIDNSSVVTQVYNGNLAPGIHMYFNFPAISLPAGQHLFCAYTSLTGDTIHSNDTLCTSLFGIDTCTIPFTDSFDTSNITYYTTSANPGTTWVKGSPQPGVFPVNGAYTSPNVWATNLGLGSYSLNANCELASPDFVIGNSQNPILSFWFTSNTDTLNDGFHVEISTDHGNTWAILGSVNYNHAINWYTSILTSNQKPGWSGRYPWTQALCDLSAFSGNSIRLKFVFTSDANNTAPGVALDNFQLLNASQVDASITNIISPVDMLITGDSAVVSFVATNFGVQSLNIWPVSYQINNGTPVYELFNLAIPVMPLQSQGLTFQQKFSVPAGNYTLKIFTQYPGDQNLSNDTAILLLHTLYPCQAVMASLDTILLSPALSDSNTLNICANESIHLVAKGIYPQNNLYYYQHDSTSTFEWNFGDGTTQNGREADHHYAHGGNYVIKLKITDKNHCESNLISGPLIVVSYNPVSQINQIPSTCIGSVNTITIGYSDTNTIKLFSQEATAAIEEQLTKDSAALIPDGGALGGSCYQIPLHVNIFDPGATITQASDIESVCVNMEHSYVGDLAISIICPNGQTVDLKSYIQSGSAWLGIPMGGVNHSSYDCSYPPSCLSDPLQNPPGTGWNYCWSNNNPEFGFMQNYANQNGSIDSGSYLPSQSLSGLVGCPINGDWTFKVCDYWAVDNGWVFSWQLKINPDLYPDLPNLNTPLDTVIWNGPFITQSDEGQMTIQPTSSGTYNYILTITDSLGCTYDTNFLVYVNESFLLDCGPDLSYQQASTNILSATISGAEPPFTYLWSTGDTSADINVSTYTTTTYYVTVSDGSGCSQIDSVTINIGGCPQISGKIFYDNVSMTPLNNTSTTLYLNNIQVSDTITDNAGDYVFEQICQPGQYNISINCTKPNGGYNAADALMAVNFFVGNINLSPIQRKAADVDLSTVINAADALHILKRFVGLSSSFNSGDWVFEDGYVSLGSSINIIKNIKGLCAGDVDRSFIPGMRLDPAVELVWMDEVINASIDSVFDLPVYANVSETYHALSLILDYLPGQIKIEEVIPNPKLVNGGQSSFVYNLINNELRMGWYSLVDVVIPDDQPLFTLKVRLRYAVVPSLSVDGSSAFADANGATIMDAKLLMPRIAPVMGENTFTVFPNPATESIMVNYLLRYDSEVSLSLVNSLGQEIILMASESQLEGAHSLPFLIGNLSPGTYSVHLVLNSEQGTISRSSTLVVQ